jgi:hypothetical protein
MPNTACSLINPHDILSVENLSVVDKTVGLDHSLMSNKPGARS